MLLQMQTVLDLGCKILLIPDSYFAYLLQGRGQWV